MPQFPLAVSPVAATLNVGVAATAPYSTIANPPATWIALVDTGAAVSVINPAVRLALLPPRVGYFPVSRAGGVQTWEPSYLVRIRLGGHHAPMSRWFGLEVIELQPATPDVAVIIGMDLLIRLELNWRGPARSGYLRY